MDNLEKKDLQEISFLAKKASEFVIKSEDDYQDALALVKECKSRMAKIEEVLGPAKDKAYRAWKEICDLIKQYQQPLQEAATILSRKAYAWQEEEKKKRLEIAVETQTEAVPIDKQQGVMLKNNWQFEIVDESVLPREYLQPDLKKIGQVVKTMKDKTNIPGVRVWDSGTVAIKKTVLKEA